MVCAPESELGCDVIILIRNIKTNIKYFCNLS